MKPILAAALIAATSGAALADDVTVTTTQSGASLREGAVDMNVYLVEEAGDYRVVASYVTGPKNKEPARLVMDLQDGQTVTYGLPGAPGYHFTFTRAGDAISVTSAGKQALTGTY
ncbi:hypothetical protein [Antarctobacter jejuensis]|uniref:hypothetical protein n=1 Tax=Antarctobacter jejuensis TaxID=1439938 RepID=UPI003FD2D401